MALTILLVTIFILITDLAFQKSLFRLFSLNNKKKLKRNGQYIFWGISFSIILYFIIFIIVEKKSSQPDYIVYRNYFNLSGLFVLIYIPKVIFILFVFIELIIRLIANLIHKIKPIPFLEKLSAIKVISGVGVLVMLIVFGIILNGIINGKTNYQTEYVSISFKNLPKNFNNLKIAQISDMHLGSFKDPKDVRKGIDRLMKEKPDIIFLTGDLVNNLS
ncbi:MAG TPA: metallophosphoesterase, partial [Bacteroidales bacterium]|nr:metallophosphoesterase [Bacteroidales bacterium]